MARASKEAIGKEIYTEPRNSRSIWNVHNRKILLTTSLVVIPMVAATVALLSIVFSNMINLNHCPYPDLCPYTDGTGPANKYYYYVDTSVGLVAFISSFSSSISFTLVAAMMTLYGYIVARHMTDVSTVYDGEREMPSAYGLSMVIRLLNAEMVVLWDMLVQVYRKAMRNHRENVSLNRMRMSRMLLLCRIVFIVSLSASIIVQVANIYVHLVINATNVERLLDEPSTEYNLSKVLAPWYFNTDETFGTNHTKFFWSSALEFGVGGSLSMANRSSHRETTDKVDSHVFNYTDAQGISYVVVHPPSVDSTLEWKGTGYSVSTRCFAIPRSSCLVRDVNSKRPTFNCAFPHPLGKNITGQFSALWHETWTDDWHQYLRESKPFTNAAGSDDPTAGLIFNDNNLNISFPKNMTLEDSNTVFRNPWHWIGKIVIVVDDSDLSTTFKDNELVMKVARNKSAFLLTCNTTVFDTNYTTMNNRISSLSVSKSNGSVAGLVSMLNLNSLGLNGIGTNRVAFEVSENITTPEAFISKYELSISKAMSVALAVHTVPAHADLVQRRVQQVVTRLPVLAFWLLVVVNLLFGLLGLILGILAARAASLDIHQVHLRLSTAGLAAQLFDGHHARHKAEKDTELFFENTKEEGFVAEKRVGVRCTAVGGAEFVTYDVANSEPMDDQNQLIPREGHLNI